jgi:tRNA(Ile)-lysidine synthase
MSLLDSESGKYITSATHRLLRNRQWLILSPLFSLENKTFLIEKATTTLDFDQNHLVIEHDKPFNTINKDVTVAQLDNKQIEYPLIIRKWKQGDYFYPLGMSKKKKVSRFFIDIKLSMLEKENAWVIESGKKIIWVVGYRIDDRFKITPSTKNVTTLKLVSPK